MNETLFQAGGSSLAWQVIRQDDGGNRYRVGAYATREDAQKVCDVLDSRGHRQLYWVEHVAGPDVANTRSVSPTPEQYDAPGHAPDVHRPARQIPPLPEAPAEGAVREPSHHSEDHTGRRLQRAKPLFEALAHILPAEARDRWCEEWLAEWADLGEQPLRARVAWLLRVTLRSGPSCAWTLRFAARRQRAQ